MNANRALLPALLAVAAGSLALAWLAGGARDAPASPSSPAEPDGPTGAVVPTAALAGSDEGVSRSSLPLVPADTGPGDAERARSTEPVAFAEDAVYGRVLGPGSSGVAGVPVLLFDVESMRIARAPVRETTTDERGRFRFEGLVPHHRYRVLVQAEGFLPEDRRAWPGQGQELRLEASVRITGRVLDASSGEPLEGVEVGNDVWHWAGTEQRPTFVTVTGADGRYELPWARLQGVQPLRLRRPGHAEETRRFQVVATRLEGYDVHLGTGRGVVLEVRDLDTGRLLADLGLTLAGRSSARTDANGRLALAAAAGALRSDRDEVTLSAPGYCRATVRLPAEEAGPPPIVPVVLAPEVRVPGRVVDAAGRGVAGATVRAGGRPRRNGVPEGVRLRDRTGPATTDEEGRFVLELAPREGDLLVRAWHADYRTAEVVFSGEGELRGIEFVLERGGGIAGIVTVDGEPVSTRLFWSKDTASGWTRSNDRGAYRFLGVPPGEVEVTARLDDESRSREHVAPDLVWVVDGEITEHDVALVSNRVPITGRVRDDTGIPLAGVHVSARANDRSTRYRTSTRTDDRGAFELEVPGSPAVSFRVRAEDGQRTDTRDEVLPGTAGVELVLARLGRLRLEVVDAAGGDRVQPFQLFWREGETFRQLHADGAFDLVHGPDGAFLAELPLSASELAVSAKRRGYPAVFVDRVRVEPEAAGAPLRVRLERGTTLSLRFTYPAGQEQELQRSIERNEMSVVSQEQLERRAQGGALFRHEVFHAQELAFEDGVARVRGLAPGRYRFLDSPDRVRLEPSRFDVPAVDRHLVEIRVEPRGEQERAEGRSGRSRETDGR